MNKYSSELPCFIRGLVKLIRQDLQVCFAIKEKKLHTQLGKFESLVELDWQLLKIVDVTI